MSTRTQRRTIKEQRARTWFDAVLPESVRRSQEAALKEAGDVSPARRAQLAQRHQEWANEWHGHGGNR